MAEATVKQLNQAVADKEGKYLTFSLGAEEYGLEILKVREIIGYIDVTAVPQTPHHIKGVINLRGQVIPVIDLRAKFGIESTEVTEETCIIVVESTEAGQKSSTGIIVDRVQEVLDIPGSAIEETPQFGASVNTDFILGMGKVEESVKILLDIDKVLSNMDVGLPYETPQTQNTQEIALRSTPEGQKSSPAERTEPEIMEETLEANG